MTAPPTSITSSPRTPMSDLLSVCIKHTPGFASRRQKLAALVASIRQHHGADIPIFVSTEAPAPGAASSDDDNYYNGLRSKGMVNKFVTLPHGSGLSAGRNALARTARTQYLALLDDDMLLRNNRSLPLLLQALTNEPETVLAGGCQWDTARDALDCFNLRFDVSDDGSVVRARRTRVSAHGCTRVHATHNFFVARTDVLRRLGWDPRQRVMEHETFFYQLYLNGMRVLACPGAVAAHDTTIVARAASTKGGGDMSSRGFDDYEQRSLRATAPGRDPGRNYFQYLCKNLPEVRRFRTPFVSWRCDTHEFCTPLWDAQFAFDGQHCASFPWDASDDASAVVRPLLLPYHNGGGEDINLRGDGAFSRWSRSRGMSPVPLLVVVLTEAEHVEQRAWQRRTWLSFRWHALSQRSGHGRARGRADGDRLIPWRYVYVMPPSPSQGMAMPNSSLLRGDVVSLGPPPSATAADRKTAPMRLGLAAIRWAVAHVEFQCLLVTHDSSLIHVGRVWEWLLTRTLAANSRMLAWSGAKAAAPQANRAPAATVLKRLFSGASRGTWLAGREACKQLIQGQRKLDRVEMLEPPGFRRAVGSGRSSALKDKLVVDSVRFRPHDYEAFRALLQAQGHVATWEAIPGLPGPAAAANFA